MAITKELAIASIVITPATGAVRVEQVQRVLEDGHELASADRLAIAALEALNKITAGEKPQPLKFAYAAARNKRKLGEFVQTYEASRQALLKQYGDKKEDGELNIDDQGNVKLVDAPAFGKAMAALHNEDLPDLKLHQVALADFPADIDVGVMEALLPMVLETDYTEPSEG